MENFIKVGTSPNDKLGNFKVNTTTTIIGKARTNLVLCNGKEVASAIADAINNANLPVTQEGIDRAKELARNLKNQLQNKENGREKEVKENKLSARIRESGRVEKISVNELAKMIAEKTEGEPFEALSLPDHLSKRPIF